MFRIDIAADFSRFPGGRYREYGKHSGEEFRNDMLIPALRQHDLVQVKIDGTVGYGSSFLEEAFGGLVRAGISNTELDKLEIVCEDADFLTFRDEILQYIADAKAYAAKTR